MKYVGIAWLVIVLTVFTCFVNNIIDFADCDFSSAKGSDYKCEIVHAVGLALPPTSIFTSFIDSDGDKK